MRSIALRCAPLALAAALAVATITPVGGSSAARAVTVAGRWNEASTRPGAETRGSLSVAGPGAAKVMLTLDGARLTSVPDACWASTTVERRSFLSADGRALTCVLRPGSAPTRTVPFVAEVVARAGGSVRGTVRVDGGQSSALPSLEVGAGVAAPRPLTRLVSSPDFLNADVGDLRRGPGFWRRSGTENSINAAYRRGLDTVLDDWRSLDPSAVLVAGDLVDGWWGTDPSRSGNFGPVRTAAQRRTALGRAAATYYPQWLRRFTERRLPVLPAMGDHEYGDDPWPSRKRQLAPAFESHFAKVFGRVPERAFPRVSRPRGVHRRTAYAVRPHPDVQLVTLNVFDIGPDRARIRLDPAQLRWLRGVLAEARRDGVTWTIVQGHTPILWPVRKRGSSGLHYERGSSSTLWRLFKRYGVDLYLAGEVHDVTASERDGITQLAHGGLFQFGLTNALVIDLFHDHATLSLRDYDARWWNARNGSRLWETRPAGMPKRLRIDRTPFTIGTGVLLPDSGLTQASGILRVRGR